MAILKEYKCPGCGGAVTFDVLSQKMKCSFCETEYEVDELEAMGAEADTPSSGEEQQDYGGQWEPGETDGMRSYVCHSCGGEIVGDENTSATICPFCGNPVVMAGNVTGLLKPDLVIPFQLDKKAAKAAYEKHLEGKKLLPRVFKSENHIDKITGIYVPFWLYSADAQGDMHYQATRTRTWSDSKNIYTETSYYAVRRSGTLHFDAVPVDGSVKMDDTLMESIEPFDSSKAVEFRTAYLAGYLADKFDVDAEAGAPRAGQRMRQSTEKYFDNTVTGYATVVKESGTVRLANSSVKYALYPVWLLNTTWNGTKYTFAMNGQTGKMVGDLPVDKKESRKWFWGITAISTVVLFVLQFLARTL